MNAKEIIIEILAEVAIGDLHYSKSLEDQGVDSLSTIDIVLAIEERFNIELPDEEFNPDTFYSAESLVAMIERLTSD